MIPDLRSVIRVAFEHLVIRDLQAVISVCQVHLVSLRVCHNVLYVLLDITQILEQ